MNIILFLLVGLTLLSPLYAQEAGGGKLEEVVIKGEYKLKLDSERPKLKVKMDINEVVMPTIVTLEKFLNLKPKDLIDLRAALPGIRASEQTIAAYLNSIITEPVAKFNIEQDKELQVDTWEVIINDSKGEVFHKFSGKQSVPRIISWSGRNDKKQIIFPGRWYSYFVKVCDVYGREYTTVGDPFRFPAIMHQEKDGLYITISDERMFGRSKEALDITKDSKLLLREAADVIKKYHTLPIKIEVYSNSEQVAIKRADNVNKYLCDVLLFPKDRMSVAGSSTYIDKQRVDIVISNQR